VAIVWSLTRRNGRFKAFRGSDQELQLEINRLSTANRAERALERERKLLSLRHSAGLRALEAAPTGSRHVDPAFDRLPDAHGLPEIAAAEVTPELLRAGILRDGCLLVRGLVDRRRALALARGIQHGFDERQRSEAGEPYDQAYFEEFCAHPRYGESLEDARPWVKEGGGILAPDSPRLAFELFELLHEAGLRQVVEGYLGEPALVSVHKSTLRRADPAVGGGWHQDGAFMGPVRSVNLWLSLSRCGDVSPGLDLVPRRLAQLVASGGEDTFLSYQVSQRVAEESAGEKGVIRPIFEPGDALLFDELFLHKTGSDPDMPNPRFAVENWFFAASAFPVEYAPLAV